MLWIYRQSISVDVLSDRWISLNLKNYLKNKNKNKEHGRVPTVRYKK